MRYKIAPKNLWPFRTTITPELRASEAFCSGSTLRTVCLFFFLTAFMLIKLPPLTAETHNPCIPNWYPITVCNGHGTIESAGTYSGPSIVRIAYDDSDPNGKIPSPSASGVTFNPDSKTTTWFDLECGEDRDPDEGEINYTPVFKWSPDPATVNLNTPGEYTFQVEVGGQSTDSNCTGCQTPLCSDVGWKTASGSLTVRVIKVTIMEGGEFNINQTVGGNTESFNAQITPSNEPIEWTLSPKPFYIQFQYNPTQATVQFKESQPLIYNYTTGQLTARAANLHNASDSRTLHYNTVMRVGTYSMTNSNLGLSGRTPSATLPASPAESKTFNLEWSSSVEQFPARYAGNVIIEAEGEAYGQVSHALWDSIPHENGNGDAGIYVSINGQSQEVSASAHGLGSSGAPAIPLSLPHFFGSFSITPKFKTAGEWVNDFKEYTFIYQKNVPETSHSALIPVVIDNSINAAIATRVDGSTEWDRLGRAEVSLSVTDKNLIFVPAY